MRELPLFQNLTERERQTVLNTLSAKEKHYGKGELICHYEGNQTLIGVILEGSAQVLRYDEANRKMVLEWLQPGDVFGEVLAFPCGFQKEEETFVACDKTTKAVYLDYVALTELCAQARNGGVPGILAANWNGILTRKVAAFGRRLEILSCRSIREKLNCYFSILAKEQRSKTIENPYNMTVLAEYLCVDRSAMVRELGVMRDAGLIKMEKKDVILL